MKSSIVCLFLLLAFCLATPENVPGQSTSASRPTSEQSLEELVREVRQLRATLQRMNTTVYKGQVLLERFKLQQEQVSRMSRELNEAREQLQDMKAETLKWREALILAEQGLEAGLKNPNDLPKLRKQIEVMSQREQRLAARETQLANELEAERAKLNELNDRLNMLESELTPK